jgi:hypothetical protein
LRVNKVQNYRERAGEDKREEEAETSQVSVSLSADDKRQRVRLNHAL